MNPQYLGIDIGGAKNIWMCALKSGGSKLRVALEPKSTSLEQIIQYAEEYPVVAVAIDAQLTWATKDETGFRPSDYALRHLLPGDCATWVVSQNSLAAVPVRGRQLAECLSPIVGTIVETHPRACLLFADKSLSESVKLYKKAGNEMHQKKLIDAWIKLFRIESELLTLEMNDGKLDALVCATIAYLFHNSPQHLQQLSFGNSGKKGRGPFIILNPR